jgi:ATP-dependent DNA helicase RecQ
MEAHLKKYYGYNNFREPQKEVIDDILDNNDVFCVLPTGGGKSLLYQFPATFTGKISIVVSPLISLMNDQVENLKQKNIKACCLNSESEVKLSSLNKYNIIYTTPEFLTKDISIFQSIESQICLFAIDEAHCISQWSHDFRKSYQELGMIKETFSNIPILAVTATATPVVIEEMENFLNTDTLNIYLGGTERSNLFISVDSKDNFKINYDEPTIVYVQTRKECEKLYKAIIDEGKQCLKYHGGLSEDEKRSAHNSFSSGEIITIIATISFGMGIDKSNIRHVINYGIPTDIETYYQEIGRAGRDGLKSTACLYYDNSDFTFANYVINTTKDLVQQNRKKNALSILRKYLNEHEMCRHKMIEYYFENGEFCTANNISSAKCKMCDNCTDSKLQNIEDVTNIALSIYKYMCNYNINCGIVKLVNTLIGSGNPQLKNKPALLSDYTKDFVRLVLEKMITKEFIFTEKWEKFGTLLKPGNKINTKIYIVAEKCSNKPIDKLSKIRQELSLKYGINEQQFLCDRTLENIRIKIPSTIEELWLIDGVTENFIIHYGSEFIKKISSKPRKQSNTVSETYSMYEEGKTIEAIAKERKLKPITIENHIIGTWEKDKSQINKNYAKITQSIEDEILFAIEKVGTEKLRPIKDIVNSNITYFQIRTVILDNAN